MSSRLDSFANCPQLNHHRGPILINHIHLLCVFDGHQSAAESFFKASSWPGCPLRSAAVSRSLSLSRLPSLILRLLNKVGRSAPSPIPSEGHHTSPRQKPQTCLALQKQLFLDSTFTTPSIPHNSPHGTRRVSSVYLHHTCALPSPGTSFRIFHCNNLSEIDAMATLYTPTLAWDPFTDPNASRAAHYQVERSPGDGFIYEALNDPSLALQLPSIVLTR